MTALAFSMIDYRTRELFDVDLHYPAYKHYRQKFSAEVLKGIFPRAEQFERRYQEERA